MFGDPSKTQFIERSTIEPAPFTIKATSVGVFNFSFPGSCPHVFEKQLIKPLFLTIGVETDAPDVNRMIPFVYDAAPRRWRAQLDLNGFQAKGYYLMSIRAAYQNGVQLPCRTAAELKAIQGPVLYSPIVWWKYGDMPASTLDQWFAKWARFTSDQFNSRCGSVRQSSPCSLLLSSFFLVVRPLLCHGELHTVLCFFGDIVLYHS